MSRRRLGCEETALLRLLADDLTGALDTAARFAPLTGPVTVLLIETKIRNDLPAALSSASREVGEAEAVRRTVRLAPFLRDGRPAFKKMDSLLRGHPAAEIATCLRVGAFDHCIIAPAFPAQRRVTRAGRQLARSATADVWSDVGVDLGAELVQLGWDVARRPVDQLGSRAPPGISLCDAETEADLDAVVASARALTGRVLWCGAAALATALAGVPPRKLPPPSRPLLACIGSNHPVSLGQLNKAAAHWIRFDPSAGDATEVAMRMMTGGIAITVGLEADLSRHAAAQRIALGFSRLLAALPRPPTLLVSGGETLRGVCLCLGADALVVNGEILPGVPVSTLRGGAWDGVALISKSGSFGEPDLLRRLLTGNFC